MYFGVNDRTVRAPTGAGHRKSGAAAVPVRGDAESGFGPQVTGRGPLKGFEELRQENQALRGRNTRLIAAILRISASLDVDTVLQEIVESARALTGARRGVITTIDERGEVQDFVTSGLPPEERRQMVEWPDRWRLFEHLRDLSAPLGVADLPGYLQSLGFSSNPLNSKTLQGTPMRHRGEHLGNLFLGDKDDGAEFTSEDEEVLALLAAQAATTIAHARTYRDERRARTDLETLVDISPVGVAVFDARTGNMVSFNRETTRIVESLRTPGQPPEHLLTVVTCRFPDGREIALDELPLAEVLREATPRRGEEVVLSVPDGRSLTTLVNAAPIHSRDGAVESVVVTIQDLAPLEELERQRAEFLGLVSHELRAPLTSIKGSTTTVLAASPELDPAETREFFRIIDEQADHMRGLIGDLLDAGRIDSGTLSVAPEPSEVAALVERARNTFLSGGGRHAILIDLPSDLPLAMADRRRIVQVLNNLFANAARYSPQSSPILVVALRDGAHVAVSVADEGRGVAPERLPHLFGKHAGGDAEGPTVRYGLGLAICKGLVEAHGGRIWAESGGPGQGTRFTFTIPVAGEAAAGAAHGSSRPSPEGHERTRILVVDDDPQALRFLRDALLTAGYAPLMTGDPRELPRLIQTEKPELVLLDLMLPGTDGIELMERIPELADLPVIFISGYRRDETVARALQLGAADYIVKPFSPMELTARVQAALRRRAEPEPFVSGDLSIDYDQRQVSVAGRVVELTATEYELLRVLSLNAGRVTTFDTLLRQVWDRRGGGDSEPVRTFVKKLRQKLGDDAAEPTYIFNERGIGYRMAGSFGRS